MAAEFTELGEYHLNDEEKGLIQKLLFSIENEKHPICTESAYDLSEFFGWKDAKNRAYIRKNWQNIEIELVFKIIIIILIYFLMTTYCRCY